jgi:hypothetical protein
MDSHRADDRQLNLVAPNTADVQPPEQLGLRPLLSPKRRRLRRRYAPVSGRQIALGQAAPTGRLRPSPLPDDRSKDMREAGIAPVSVSES